MNEAQGYSKSNDNDSDKAVFTMEEQLNELRLAAVSISSLAYHIHGTLFGFENVMSDQTKMDDEPSFRNTLFDIASIMRKTFDLLNEVSSSLTDQKRLDAKY